MGGSSTFGVEQADGSVIYNIYRDTIFHDSILHEYKKGRTVEVYYDEYFVARSVADYYSDLRFEEEDSVVRGLQRLDGTLEWRQWGDKGVCRFTKDM